jgi:pimeloyl-ACP methyl ester carboxylesterase
MAKECEDVRALQAQTGARYLFGHSFGGLVALEVARNNAALTQVAVYEPGVSIDGSVPVDWVPCCRSELERGAAFEAFVTFARGVNPESSGKLPRWLFKLILRRVMGDEEIRRKEWLLPEAIREHLEVASLDNQYERYRDIAGEVTVLVGGRGPGAAKAGRTAQRLCTVLPRAQRVRLPKLDHFGPEQQPATVARALLEAFAAAGHASPAESVAV